METKVTLFRRAVMSGLCIGIGCWINLACEVKYLGAFLFTVGLYTILTQGFALYTGMVGYLPYNRNLDYLIQLLVVIAGNFTGTACVAIPVQTLARQGAAVREAAAKICEVKVADSPASLFVLGIGCGILMYIAVHSYKTKANTDGFSKLFATIVAIPTFILCGMEHSIADMAYFSFAGAWSVKAVLCIVVILLGNAVGGMLIPIISWNIKKD